MVVFRDEGGRFISKEMAEANLDNRPEANRSLIDLDDNELEATLREATQSSAPVARSTPIYGGSNTTTPSTQMSAVPNSGQTNNDVIVSNAPPAAPSSSSRVQTVNSAAQPISSINLNNQTANSAPHPSSTADLTHTQRMQYLEDRFEQLWSQAQSSGDFASAHDRIAALIRLKRPPTVPPVEQQQPTQYISSSTATNPMMQQQAAIGHPHTIHNSPATPQIPFSAITQQMASNPTISNAIPASWMYPSVQTSYGYQLPTHPPSLQNQQGFATNANSNSTPTYNAKYPPPKMESEYLQYWFVKLERWFENMNVHNDHAKFNTLVGLIEHRQMTHVLDVVMTPPPVNQYNTLKQAMMTTLSDSQQIRYQKLINAGELGDQKPSFRLNELRRLAGGDMNDVLMKQIWLNQLPSEIRAVLAVCHDQDLNSLAKKADDVAEGLAPKRVAAVTHTAPFEEPQFVSEIREAIEQIQRELRSPRATNTQANNRSRSSNRNRSSSRRRSDSTDTESVCWYHRTFAEESQKCRQPCKHFEDFQKSKN